MKIFTVSDLHLPGGIDKTMDMFGPGWQGHWNKIQADWQSRVSEEDVVLIAGDISWAMQLEAALPDLQAIGRLPGKKLLIRGNHDFWWNSVTRVRQNLPKDMFVLQNDAIKIENFVFAGTRGWMDTASPEDKKIFAREKIRLELTLSSAKKLMDEASTLLVMLHYPPVLGRTRFNEYCGLLEEYGVKYCIYGHLHGVAPVESQRLEHNNITYILSSCDMIDFKLREVL